MRLRPWSECTTWLSWDSNEGRLAQRQMVEKAMVKEREKKTEAFRKMKQNEVAKLRIKRKVKLPTS